MLTLNLTLTEISTAAVTETHVSRSNCFRLAFRGDFRQYAEVGRVLWSSMRQRFARLYDEQQLNASVVVLYSEEYVIPSAYVDFSDVLLLANF